MLACRDQACSFLKTVYNRMQLNICAVSDFFFFNHTFIIIYNQGRYYKTLINCIRYLFSFPTISGKQSHLIYLYL